MKLARPALLPVVIAGLVSTALGFGLVGIQGAIGRAEAALEAGEGQRLLWLLERRLGRGTGPPTQAELELALERFWPEGLRYLSVPGPPGEPSLEAGSPQGDRSGDVPGPRWVGSRLRVVMPPPPPGRGPPRTKRPPKKDGPFAGPTLGPTGFPPWRRDGDPSRPDGPRRPPPPPPGALPPGGYGSPPPPHLREPPPRREGGPPQLGSGPRRPFRLGPPQRHRRAGLPGPPQLVMELEPKSMRALHSESRRVLGFGLIAIAALLVGGAVTSRLMAREARVMEARAAEHRMAVLGRTSALLAHELRNPLAAVKGHAQLLEEALSTEGRARAKASVVVSEVVRLERLISGVLDFLRVGRLERRDTEVRPMLKAAGRRSVAQSLVWGPVEVERFSMDGDRVEQLLVNLLDNAEQAEPGADVRLSVLGRGRAMEIVVEDRGPGFEGPAEALFDPLRTSKAKGTGLGLLFVREVAQAHGGDVRAELRAEGGARFIVTLAAPR